MGHGCPVVGLLPGPFHLATGIAGYYTGRRGLQGECGQPVAIFCPFSRLAPLSFAIRWPIGQNPILEIACHLCQPGRLPSGRHKKEIND